jgi:hypothetical protein
MTVKSRATILHFDSISESSHYPSKTLAGIMAALPHIDLVRLSEVDLRATLSQLKRLRPTAVIINSGALHALSVRDILKAHEDELVSFMRDGGTLALFLETISGEDFTFTLDNAIQARVVIRRRDQPVTIVRSKWVDGIPGESPVADLSQYWTVTATELSPPVESAPLILSETKDGSPDGDIVVCEEVAVGRGRLIIGNIKPLTNSRTVEGQSVFAKLFSHIGRRNTLLATPEMGQQQESFRQIDSHHSRSALYVAEDEDDFRRFLEHADHLYVTDTWYREFPECPGALVARLLRGGSVRIVHSGASRFETILKGPPDYFSLIDSLARDLRAFTHTLPSGATFNVVSYALLVKLSVRIADQERWLPDIFRFDYAKNVVRQAIKTRVSAGSVDGQLLPTFNLYVAAQLFDIDDSTTRSMVAWMSKLKDADPDIYAQCQVMAHLAEIDGTFLVEHRNNGHLSYIGSLESAFYQLSDDQKLSLDESFATRTDLEKALTLLLFQRQGVPFTQAQNSFLESFLAHHGVESIETFCYLSILLLEHLTSLPIRSIQDGRTSGLELFAGDTSEREANLQAAVAALNSEMDHAADEANARYQNLLSVSKALFSVIIVLSMPIMTLALGLPWWAFVNGWVDLPTAIGFTVGIAATISVLLVYVMKQPKVRVIAPRWLVAVTSFLRDVRS